MVQDLVRQRIRIYKKSYWSDNHIAADMIAFITLVLLQRNRLFTPPCTRL